ncbi:MAG: acyltransferase [Clostridia bacterium]|nr:acyltransferase [Clostridia bacterium]
MIFPLTQFYIKTWRPSFNGFLTRMLYSGKRVKIGKNFKAATVPKMIVDANCQLIIGDNVEFRRHVEVRSHGQSQIQIEDNVRIDRGVRLLAANDSRITLKKGARVGLYTVFNGGSSITIGEKVLISGFVYLQTSMHAFEDKKRYIQDQGYHHAPITLEDGAWLGTHVVIMPGVTLGKGTVVGSNAVVTKSFDDNEVVIGIPGKALEKNYEE